MEQDIILATRTKRAVLQFKQDSVKRAQAITIQGDAVFKAQGLK